MTQFTFRLASSATLASPYSGEVLAALVFRKIVSTEGRMALQELLESYLQGDPFLVISDAFPFGLVPLPTMPESYWKFRDYDYGLLVKAVRARRWLRADELYRKRPRPTDWRHIALDDGGAVWLSMKVAPFYEITGENVLDNAASEVLQKMNRQFELHVTLDTDRFPVEKLCWYLRDIGRNTPVMLHKFEVMSYEPARWSKTEKSSFFMTLSTSQITEWDGLDLGKSHLPRSDDVGARWRTFTIREPDEQFADCHDFIRPGGFICLEEPEHREFVGCSFAEETRWHLVKVYQGYAPLMPLPEMFLTKPE